MGAITIQNTEVVFGIPDEIKPLEGFPAGRARLRLRPTDYASVSVKTSDGFRHFFIVEKEGRWHPYIERGRSVIADDANPVAEGTCARVASEIG